MDSSVKNMVTSLRAVGELQNPAIRDRHWEQLMQATQVSLCMFFGFVKVPLINFHVEATNDTSFKVAPTNIHVFCEYPVLIKKWMHVFCMCRMALKTVANHVCIVLVAPGEVCDVRRDQPGRLTCAQLAQV